jgi:copper transport protein
MGGLTRLGVGLGAALAIAALGVRPASAHAALVSSNPGNGAVLAMSPGHVLLQFDVPVNPVLSDVTLQNRAGTRVDGPAIDVEPGVSSVLTVELPSLQQGVYRLDFRARDDTDLHETVGAIVFGIGEAADLEIVSQAQPAPSYLETGSRWVALAGLCLLVGIVTIWLGILPVAGRGRPVTRAARGRLLALAALGYAAIVVGKAGQLLITAVSLSAGDGDLPGATWSALTAGEFGLLWLTGMGLAVLTLVAVRAALSRQGSRAAGAVLVIVAGALVVVSSATSHGENMRGADPFLVTLRAVHLASAGLWAGGLTVLVFLFAGALRGASPEGPSALVAFRRFTGLAFLSVGLLTVSGLLLTARGVESAATLITTTYGLTLLAKMIAGAAALAFGIRHTLLLSPPRGAGVGGPVRLARSVPFEVGTMLVVLWTAAALGATAPSTAGTGAPAGVAPMTADTTSQVQDLVVRTSMAPGRTGTNTLLVEVRPAGGQPVAPVTNLRVTLWQLNQPPQTVTGRRVGPGRYAFPSVQVAAAGRLDVRVSITRSGGTQASATALWTVAPPPSAPPPVLPDTPWAPALEAAAIAVALAVAGALGAWIVLSHRRRVLAASGQ